MIDLREFFRQGDIVRLRSGGPRMTVVTVDSGPSDAPELHAKLAWHDDAQQLQRAYLPLDCLEPDPRRGVQLAPRTHPHPRGEI